MGRVGRVGGVGRRQFIYGAGATLATLPVLVGAQTPDDSRRVFLHGVASGDPLENRVVLWTRATPAAATAASAVSVRWRLRKTSG